jgi:hypothetical protein
MANKEKRKKENRKPALLTPAQKRKQKREKKQLKKQKKKGPQWQ